jgi:hypothetical protein
VKPISMRIIPMILLAGTFAGSPASAQDTAAQPGDEKINQLIIYGQDKCPESTGDEIVVCSRLDEKDRYRIPKNLRDVGPKPGSQAWSQRLKSYEYVGASGAMSCSASGAGGFTGCGLREIDAAYIEKAQDPGLAFGRLIAAEREKRLAGIDAESELVEDRVIAEERAEAARKLQEQANDIRADSNADVPEAGPLPEPK